MLVLDEAHALTFATSGETTSAFRRLRNAANKFKLILIFLSTSSKIDVINPILTASARPAPSVHVKLAPLIDINTTECIEERHDHIFFCGRPLWFSLWTARLEMDFRRLVDFAIVKLNSRSKGMLALSVLIACRFGLQPVQTQGAEFVSDFMGTLIEATEPDRPTSTSTHLCRVEYPSEPILAEASAYLIHLHGGYPLEDVLHAVFMSLKMDLGILLQPKQEERDKLVAAIALGLNCDLVKLHHLSRLSSKASALVQLLSLSLPLPLPLFSDLPFPLLLLYEH